MKYYVEARDWIDGTDPGHMIGFTFEAGSLNHAVQRFSDFAIGVEWAGMRPPEITGVRTKPTRGVDYKELLT